MNRSSSPLMLKSLIPPLFPTFSLENGGKRKPAYEFKTDLDKLIILGCFSLEEH